MKNYEFIEHTADIGVRIKGKDLKELFLNAALVMFDIIAKKQERKINKRVKLKIALKAESAEELLVNWLNELLSLSSAKELIFSEFQINKIGRNSLQAVVTGEDAGNYKINTEIKAATYHQLKVEGAENRWQAEVIFDV